MAEGYESLPREIHDGLCQLLTSIALIEDPQEPVAILTTAPSQWLARASLGSFEIVDISRITGMTGWQSDSDVLSGVIDAARNAGWPNESIDLDFHGPIRPDMPRPATSFRPDIVLKSHTGTPVAVVEVKRGIRDLPDVLARVRNIAFSLGAPYAIVTDGTCFTTAEGTRPEQVYESFPSPLMLNLPLNASQTTSFQTLSVTELDVRKPENLDDLSKFTNSLSLTNYIVDPTIPWGMRGPSVQAALNKILPENRHGTDHVDLISGILALVTANYQVNRLTGIVPRFLMENPAHTSVRNYLLARLMLLGVVELPAATLSQQH